MGALRIQTVMAAPDGFVYVRLHHRRGRPISGRSNVFLGPTPDRLYVLAASDVAQARPVVLTVDVSGL